MHFIDSKSQQLMLNLKQFEISNMGRAMMPFVGEWSLGLVPHLAKLHFTSNLKIVVRGYSFLSPSILYIFHLSEFVSEKYIAFILKAEDRGYLILQNEGNYPQENTSPAVYCVLLL
jgi:hypothetical protein